MPPPPARASIGNFTRDEGTEFGMPPLGGEIVVTDLWPDGIVTKVVGRGAFSLLVPHRTGFFSAVRGVVVRRRIRRQKSGGKFYDTGRNPLKSLASPTGFDPVLPP